MDFFEMAADLPRSSYCKRQQEGKVCQTRTQCIHCELYSQGMLPAHYPVPAVFEKYSYNSWLNWYKNDDNYWVNQPYRGNHG